MRHTTETEMQSILDRIEAGGMSEGEELTALGTILELNRLAALHLS